MIVYAVVDDALLPDFPLGDAVEVFVRCEDAELTPRQRIAVRTGGEIDDADSHLGLRRADRGRPAGEVHVTPFEISVRYVYVLIAARNTCSIG